MNTPSTPAEQAIRAARQAQDGADAARQVLEQAAQRRPAIVHARIPDGVQAAGHWPLAYEEGTWPACLASDPAQPIQSDRHAAQWVCRGGTWLIRAEVFVALGGTGPGLDMAALP